MFCGHSCNQSFQKSALTKQEYKHLRQHLLLQHFKQEVQSQHTYMMQLNDTIQQSQTELQTMLTERDRLKTQLQRVNQQCTQLKNCIQFPEKVVRQNVSSLKYCCDKHCNHVLNAQLECTHCKRRSCPSCLQTYESESHSCQPLDVFQETKPCPMCHTHISKIDGCDQMWCIECRTGFSWATGTVLQSHRSTYENPHRIEFYKQQEKGYFHYGVYYQQLNPTTSKLRACLHRFVKQVKLPREYVFQVINMKQNVVEMQHSIHAITEKIESNTNLQSFKLKYVSNQLNDERLTDHLWKRECNLEKWSHLRSCLDLYVVAVTHLLQNMLESLQQPPFRIDSFYQWLAKLQDQNNQFNNHMEHYMSTFHTTYAHSICEHSWVLH